MPAAASGINEEDMNQYVNKKAEGEFGILLFAWVFVIESTTFYIKSNTADNIFQLFCCLVMVLLFLAKAVRKTVYIDPVLICYLLLTAVTVMPDIAAASLAGIKTLFSFLMPLVLFLFLTDYYHGKETVSHKIFLIPLVYGLFVIMQGLILEMLNLMGFPLKLHMMFVEKTGNYVNFAPFGLGGTAAWGRAFGRDLLRIQGYYIEPSKAAAFLLIPVFLSWGFYRKYKKKRYLLLMCLGVICLILTMSRAGMVAAVGAAVLGCIIRPAKREKKAERQAGSITVKDLKKLFAAALLFVIAAVLLIRFMVFLSGFFPSLTFLYVGITDESGRANLIRSETVDSRYLFRKLTERPWGYGFTGADSRSGLLETNLANAWILWLMAGGILGGIIALMVIVTAMFYYAVPALRSRDSVKRALGMLFAALTLHSLSYGTWMTADYLMILALLGAVKGKQIV